MNFNLSTITPENLPALAGGGDIIGYVDRKGAEKTRTTIGAIAGGGAALKALKDDAFKAAAVLATNGRYRPAVEAMGCAFGKIEDQFRKMVGSPWSGKTEFRTFCRAILNQDMGKSGKWTVKQESARALASLMLEWFDADDAAREEAKNKADAEALAKIGAQESQTV